MADLKTQLLPKNSPFQKIYSECENRIKRIKLRNDHLQKNAGTDMEREIAEEVDRQKESMQADITELRNLIRDMEGRFKDTESRNKLRKIKKEAEQQFQRNTAIIRDFITKSFVRLEGNMEKSHMSSMRGSTHQNSAPIGKQQINPAKNSSTRKPNPIFEPYKESVKLNPGKQDGSFLSQSQKESEIDIDYDIHRKLETQKRQLLNKVEKDAVQLNGIMNEIAQMIDQQGENVNQMEKNIQDAHQNVVEAGTNMESANELQKKARKKTMCLVFMVLMLVILVGGLVYFLAF